MCEKPRDQPIEQVYLRAVIKTSFPRNKVKVLLLEGPHSSASKTLRTAGYTNITRLPKSISKDDLLHEIKDVHVLGIRSKTRVDADVIKAAEKLLAVGCFCIGTNQVDLKDAAQNGVAVFNSPFMNTRSVAELVIAFSIMLIRKIPMKNKAAHEGLWLKDARGSNELRGKRIGIVGYGHIGSQVSVMAEALGMQVSFFDIEPKLPLGNANVEKSLKALVQNSDVVTCHVPETRETKGMINKTILKSFKRNSILLNLSRGSVCDLNDVAESLNSGQLAGGAFDVFPREPKGKGEVFESILQGMDNVILTPHIGGSTEEAQENIGIDTATKLVNFIESGSTLGNHSLPELNLPILQKAHRILHVHKNVPGALSRINSAMGKAGINIEAQYLKTDNDVGYVVLDVEHKAGRKALDALKNLKGTIKARVLY